MKTVKWISLVLIASGSLVSSAECFEVSRGFAQVSVGKLCFAIPAKSVGVHQFVDITVDVDGEVDHVQYFGMGLKTVHNCIHTKEGPVCHDAQQLSFGKDNGFGELKTITLALPDMNEGFAELDNANYDLFR